MLRRPVLQILLAAAVLCGPAAALSQPAAAPPVPSMAPELLKPNLVDIGSGRRLNLTCVGKGEPVVLFEQGEDATIPDWKRVQPAIAALTRTCVYDRAGFGYSDPPAQQISGIATSDDLRRLLKAADINQPIVIVGEGIGGFYATLHADRFPAQVAGLVLVDPAFADQFKPANDKQRLAWWKAISQSEAELSRCAGLARTGALTQAAPSGCFVALADYTAEEAAAFYHARTQASWYESALAQSQAYYPRQGLQSLGWRQEFLARRNFGAMPLEVLTAETFPKAKGQKAADYKLMSDQWRAGHVALAARSTRGQATVAPGSARPISRNQPQAVIDAVTKVVGEVRASMKAPAAKAAPRAGKKRPTRRR